MKPEYHHREKKAGAVFITLLLVGWCALYWANLNLGNISMKGKLDSGELSGDDVGAIVPGALVPEDMNLMEHSIPVFHFPDMPLPRLERILIENWELELVYPEEMSEMVLPAGNLSGKPLAGILLEMLQPKGYGFFRQGNAVHIIPMDLRHSEKTMDDKTERQSSNLTTNFRTQVSKPLELWIGEDPLLSLKITIQPLFGEEIVNPEMSIELEAMRNQQTWFYQKIETYLDQTGNLEVTGRQYVSCQITPTNLEENQWVNLKLGFNYETISNTD
ncbi:MAG: hypothetical protein ACLFUS_11530 [Candidatus Sumerlaeia bacterium]